jgi:hypothetical protein
MARGWIEPAVGRLSEGMFDAQRQISGYTSKLVFMPKGAKSTEAQYFSWGDVQSVRLMQREDLPPECLLAHEELFGNKGLTDPYIILGSLLGPSGVPRSDLFVLVPIADLGSSSQWMDLFQMTGSASASDDT